MKKTISFILALAMILTMCIVPAFAATYSIQASDYFYEFDAYITERSNGDLRINYEVLAKDTMTTLGTTIIYLYCDGTRVASYSRSTNSSMCASNTAVHSGYVTYTETEANSEYYAYVLFYAKDSSGSETASCYTESIYT